MLGISRHPFTGKRELSIKSVKERNKWIETATHYANGESFWRESCQERCARDGHVYIRCQDDSADYCTCCGHMSYQ